MDPQLHEILQRLTALEIKVGIIISGLVFLAVPVWSRIVRDLFDEGGKMRKLFTVISILCAASFASLAYGGPPLNIQLDPAVHGALLSATCLGVTQIWKKWILPKASTKTLPWISIGVGAIGAIATGFGNGGNIGQVLYGMAAGGLASGSFDLLDTIRSGFKALGIQSK